jgi:hypothetical protein
MIAKMLFCIFFICGIKLFSFALVYLKIEKLVYCIIRLETASYTDGRLSIFHIETRPLLRQEKISCILKTVHAYRKTL